MSKYKIPPFDEIVSLDSLFASWNEFKQKKKIKNDVALFASRLIPNLLSLERDLKTGAYKHGPYYHFKINDPKPRDIHKALVRDRIIHHALYRALYPHFTRRFIFDSYSCQMGKGTHRALKRLAEFSLKSSRNFSGTVWVLKGDVKKCFASINHQVLKSTLMRDIKDTQTVNLLAEIIDSFSAGGEKGTGNPLGNLTSQLFVNIYLNDFDQFIKHELKAKYYVRYADDFVVLSSSQLELKNLISKIDLFLRTNLKLFLHPDKVYIKSFASGIDFLGWVHFFKYRTLRTVTQKRMMRRIGEHPTPETISSYLGLLKHGQAYKLSERIRNEHQT